MGNNLNGINPSNKLINSCRYLSTKNVGIVIGVTDTKELTDIINDQYLCLVNSKYDDIINAKSNGDTVQLNNAKLFGLKEFSFKKTLDFEMLEYKFDDDVILTLFKRENNVIMKLIDPSTDINFEHIFTTEERKKFLNISRHSTEFDYIQKFLQTDIAENYLHS